MKAVEQIGGARRKSSQRLSVRRVKRAARRLFRHLGKAMGIDAPIKPVYRGYWD